MKRRKRSVTINFFTNMSEISEETEELLTSEDRLSERSSASNSIKGPDKESCLSAETKDESDTEESDLLSEELNSPERGLSLVDKNDELRDPFKVVDNFKIKNDLDGIEMKDFDIATPPSPCHGVDAKSFEIEVNYTSDSDRLGLYGEYYLTVKSKTLDLEDKSDREVLHSWKYEHIRRFGYNKSTCNFLMLTGRRSETGIGVFDFQVTGDPRQIIDALQGKPGCTLRLADSAKRISAMM